MTGRRETMLEKKKIEMKVPIERLVLRITAARDVSNEARVAGMRFIDEVSAYSVRDPAFKRATEPISVRLDAPAIVREMVRCSALAGVGPVCTFQGALLDYVGFALAQDLKEMRVSCGDDHFILARKRSRFVIPSSPELALWVPGEFGPTGIHTAASYSSDASEHNVVLTVMAQSCILADAGAAAASEILSARRPMQAALAFLQEIPGIHGALIVRGKRIGLAGSVEIAA